MRGDRTQNRLYRESLEHMLEAQYQLCKVNDVNPNEEPFIQELESSIRALTPKKNRI